MIDDATLNAVAARTGVPPTLLKSVLRQQLPATVTSLYPEASQSDAFAAEAAAQTLSQNFNRTGQWDTALAGYFTGDTHLNPQSGLASQVNATIAQGLLTASSHNMEGYGTGGYAPAAASGWNALAQSGEQFFGQGGALDSNAVSWAAGMAQRIRGVQNTLTGGSWAAMAASQVQGGSSLAPKAGQTGFVTPSGDITVSPDTTPGGGSLAPGGGNLAGSGAAALMADPFGRGMNPGITQGFGTSGEQGADYGVVEHTPIFSGFSGTLHIGHYGSSYTGLSAWVDNGQGWQFFVGHLYNLPPGLTDGQHVNAGDLLAYSGGGKDAPEPGHTSGPHVEIQIRKDNGNGTYTFYDPSQRVTQAEKQTFPPDVRQGMESAVAQYTRVQMAANRQPTPKPTDPQHVELFANQARASGITDPQHIVDTLPRAAPIYRQATGKPPTMQELSRLVGLNDQEISAAVNSKPHPTYTNLSLGDVRNSFYASSLHSMPLAGRMPTVSEAARFVAAGYGDVQMQNYYKQQAGSPTVQPPTPTPGAQGDQRTPDKVGMETQ